MPRPAHCTVTVEGLPESRKHHKHSDSHPATQKDEITQPRAYAEHQYSHVRKGGSYRASILSRAKRRFLTTIYGIIIPHNVVRPLK